MSFLKRLQADSHSRPRKPQRQPRSRNRRQLEIDWLEERSAPGQLAPVFGILALDPVAGVLIPGVVAAPTQLQTDLAEVLAGQRPPAEPDALQVLTPSGAYLAPLPRIVDDRATDDQLAAPDGSSVEKAQVGTSILDDDAAALESTLARPASLPRLASGNFSWAATTTPSLSGAPNLSMAGAVRSPEAFVPQLVQRNVALDAAMITAAEPVGTPVHEFVFQMTPGQSAEAIGAIALANAAHASVEDTGVHGIYKVQAAVQDLRGMMSELSSHPLVARVAAPFQVSAALAPDDPFYTDGSLWGMNGTHGIKAPQGWDNTTGSTKVTIAGIDSGVDYDHPDLYKNIWVNQGEIPAANKANIQSDPAWDIDADGLITFWDLNDARNQGPGEILDTNADGRITGTDLLAPTALGGWANSSSDDGDGFVDDLIGWNFITNSNDPKDDNGHGTHTAGTIGAVGNNTLGVVGVNWKTQLMALKFLDAGGSGSDANAALATYYAADHGARVSNNSYGSFDFSDLLNDAITYANTKGHIFVAAAGNSNSNNDTTPFYPASHTQENVVAVAATTSSGTRSSFSNYGATSVDLGAPGSSILSTVPGAGYAFFSGTSMAAPHVAGVFGLVFSQNPTWTVAQAKSQVLNTVTPLSSLAGITVTGGLVNAQDATTLLPEIQVLDGATDIPDGAGSVAFGSTWLGVPVSKTFTVKNLGTANLTLTPPITAPAGFTVTSSFGSTTLAPGASTTFTVRLDAATAGSYSGTVSFANNDSNENPFNFTVSGTVVSTVIVDDGDTGFSTTGSWSPWTTAGYQNDLVYSAAGSGSDQANWTFAVVPGQYRVSTTWVQYPNRATNAPYTVFDGATPLGTARLNQELAPNDFTDSGAAWEDIGIFTIAGTTLAVRLTDDANEYVIGDAIRIEKLTPAPEIQVLDGVTDISDGSGSVSYGTTVVGTPISKTFTVKNVGGANLSLTPPINVPSGFTVTASFGSTTLAPGASTTFTVRLDAAVAGTYSGTVSFGNNDANENPFDFTVSGTVTSGGSPVQIIDNGATGYATVGSWTPWTLGGYLNDLDYSASGSGADQATWTFSVTPGTYRVSATWVAYPNRATNAPFTVLDGATALGTTRLNQELSPNDFADAGASWEDVGTFIITGTTLSVRLSDDANEYVIADAIRIERVADGPEIQVLDGAVNVPDAGSVSYGTTLVGVPVTKTFTVKNLGTTTLSLSEPISVPAGFTLVSSFGSTSLAPGASTAFTVRLAAASAGSYSGTVSFANNDSDENPFNFTVTGTVASRIIVDDGDSGFSTTSGWTHSIGQGFQNDVTYAAAGTGSAVATWTQTLAPGQYRVSATWSPYPNRATNSPFTVYDGVSPLGTVRLNQELAPNDFSDGGANWEDLGTFTITGTTLVVKLTNDANEYVIADAVRIERLS